MIKKLIILIVIVIVLFNFSTCKNISVNTYDRITNLFNDLSETEVGRVIKKNVSP